VNRKRGSLSNPEALLCLAIMRASERWTRTGQDWPAALYHLAIVFPGRVPA
jgi:transposase-like protein